jgi:cytidylate kinase
MNATSPFERAATYLAVQLGHSGPVGADRTVRPFVTISREAGTGGAAFAAALCERLTAEMPEHPWELHSGDLIEESLRSDRLPPALARFLPEDRIHELDASVGELLGLHPSLWTLVASLNEFMRRLARRGHTVLLGRGANFATAGIPGGLHLRLIADPAERAAATARRRSLSPELAAERNALCDAARRRYVRANFDRAIEDPTAYTLVLHAGRLPPATRVELVAELVRQERSRAVGAVIPPAPGAAALAG